MKQIPNHKYPCLSNFEVIVGRLLPVSGVVVSIAVIGKSETENK